MNDTMKRFLRQLGFWSIHGTLLVLPSFLIAGLLLSVFDSPAQIAAMLAGTLPFLFGFAALTTFAKPFQDPQHLLPRALRLALLLRIATVLLFGLFSLGAPIFLWAIPDIWAGLGAALAIEWVGNQLGYASLLDTNFSSALLVFFCTVLEGILLSFLMSLLTFFCLLFLNRKETKRWQGTHPQAGSLDQLLKSPSLLVTSDSVTQATHSSTATPILRESSPSPRDDKPLQPKG